MPMILEAIHTVMNYTPARFDRHVEFYEKYCVAVMNPTDPLSSFPTLPCRGSSRCVDTPRIFENSRLPTGPSRSLRRPQGRRVRWAWPWAYEQSTGRRGTMSEIWCEPSPVDLSYRPSRRNGEVYDRLESAITGASTDLMTPLPYSRLQ